MINNFSSWTEIGNKIYRYPIAPSVTYEIQIMHWEQGTSIEKATASAYIVGEWRNRQYGNYFEREALLEESTVEECMSSVLEDYRKYSGISKEDSSNELIKAKEN